MKARFWAIALSILFGAVLAWYLVYTQQLVNALRGDAAALSRMYAGVFQGLGDPGQASSDLALFDMLVEIQQLGIPVVIIDVSGLPSAATNLPFVPDLSDAADRQRVLRYTEALDRRNEPIIDPAIGEIHFGVPAAVDRLRWVPWTQAATLLVIVLSAVSILRSTLRAERERVWSTMARESAHQLGTPLSSLAGWVEILRMPITERAGVATDEVIAREVATDVDRLNKVAQRFELIGRKPRMQTVRVADLLQDLERYFAVRVPRLDRPIQLDIHAVADLPPVAGNPVLLEWAFENIIKNSLDVLAGRGGRIEVRAERGEGGVRIRFMDDGPGVPPDLRAEIFEAGTSRKKDGWGIGLSLTRRIVEETHGGTIVLGRPEVGAEFVVELPPVPNERLA